MPVRGLEYLITLNDQISKPLRAIKGEFDRIGTTGRDSMAKIAAGAAGLVATGASLYGVLQPAIELNNELGKIKGLGESAEGLELLRKRALAFSNTWGESANEFVAASYDIKSAIDGLTTEELANFTELSAITGKATQTQGQIMTDYLGTMYSVMGASKEADKTKWAEKLLGQTAYTANRFKSDGAKIAEAFKTLGNQATLAGVDIAEQFAVLGTLQNEMGGGESATKYAAFLNSIGGAAEGLGIKVHDSQNRLLSTTVILDKIRARFGDTIDDLEAQAIKGEMGRKEGVAFINTLLQKNEELKKSIREIGAIDGMEEVYAGAEANVDVFKQLSNIIKNIAASIGSQVLKKITPYLSYLAKLGGEFVDWLETYKNIARWLGYIVGGVIIFTGLAAGLTLLSGIFSAIALSVSAIFGPLALVVAGIGAVIYIGYKFRDEFAAFFAGIAKGFSETSRGFAPLFSALSSIWLSVQRLWAAFQRVFATIFSGSDSLQTFGSIGEAVGYVLGSAFNGFISVIELIASLIEQVASIFEDVAVIIINAWQDVLAAWGNNDIWGVFNAIGSGITNIFTRVLHGVKNMFFTFLNWLIDKVNSLGSYIGIELPKIAMAEMPTPEIVPQLKNASAGTANLALQMASQVGAQQLAPKPDSNGQVFSLGSANPPKLEKSPQLNKTMNTTQHNYRNVTIQKIEVNSSKDAMREMKELQELK